MAARLSAFERARIAAMRSSGAAAEGIAVVLGRHRATVYRELGRCGGPKTVYDAVAPRMQARSGPGAGRAGEAQDEAALVAAGDQRGCGRRATAGVRGDDLPGRVQRLRTRLRSVEGPAACAASSLASQPAQREKASPLGDYRPLSERPAAVGERSEPGHWEGDLIIGAANRTAAATLVERVSRHVLVVALPHGYTAPGVADAVTQALARQPAHLVRAPTWDQGRELARWADIESALGIGVFFCEPHSPSQRGTNEQTNGQLRRWLPKGTPLDLSPLRLSIIEDNLNWMARRLHNWQSAADAYTQLTRNHQ